MMIARDVHVLKRPKRHPSESEWIGKRCIILLPIGGVAMINACTFSSFRARPRYGQNQRLRRRVTQIERLEARQLLRSQVVITGNRITLSLADVLPGTVADLNFRLINNDSDTGTAAAIRSVEFQSTFPGTNGLRSSSPNPSGSLLVPGLPAFPSSPTLPGTLSPPVADAVLGRAPTLPGNLSSPGGSVVGGSEGSVGTIIESRGTEFWVGFPDNRLKEPTDHRKYYHQFQTRSSLWWQSGCVYSQPVLRCRPS